MKRTKVQSSNLSSIGYDPKAKILEVEFIGGAVYQYTGVPADVNQALVEIHGKGGSVGSMFSAVIKGKYPYIKMPEAHHAQPAAKSKSATKSAGSTPKDSASPGRKRRKATPKAI